MKPFRWLLLLTLLPFWGELSSSAQNADSNASIAAAAQKLFDAKQWDELIQLTSAQNAESPDIDFLRGMALMRLERYAEAREAFSAGNRAAPNDTRFLIERAGAEYRLKDFAAAKLDLRRAVLAHPRDEYALEFLGTIYLLEDNADAALKYWNRAGKPRLSSVALQPEPRLPPRLRDNAVSFNAPQLLESAAWLKTDARLGNLEIFPERRLELTPAGEQDYAAILHLSERDGRDNLRWTGLISLLRGAAYQTAYPDWYNIGGRAINFSSIVRWDDQKRRAFASVSLPVELRADRAASIFVDARDENWNLSQTFSGSALPVNNLNLRSIEAGIDLRFVINGDWSWNAGTSVIGRTFKNTGATAEVLFTSGTTMKSWIGTTYTLLRVPERRFTIVGTANSQFGRGFKEELGPFGSLSGSVKASWLPHASGNQDSLSVQGRAGNVFGTVPLDQVFELGLDRDSPLWLRGHGATIDGKKGGAPLGRRFVLINSDYERTIYNGGILRFQVGPMLDMGRISDSSVVIGDRRWLVDTGVQAKLRVLGTVSIMLSYGRDLRNGKGAFFATTEY